MVAIYQLSDDISRATAVFSQGSLEAKYTIGRHAEKERHIVRISCNMPRAAEHCLWFFPIGNTLRTRRAAVWTSRPHPRRRTNATRDVRFEVGGSFEQIAQLLEHTPYMVPRVPLVDPLWISSSALVI